MTGKTKPLEFLAGLAMAAAMLIGSGALLGVFLGAMAAAAHAVYGFLT
jgi:hypothetical protein